MASLAFALPLLPGQTEPWRQWSAELAGPRRDEYRASRQRLGITTERAFLQQTPQGDLVVVYLETADPGQALAGIGSSQEPFDRWFRQKGQELWGIDLAQPLPGPFSTLVFEGPLTAA